MIGKLLKTALTTIKLPFSILEDAGDTLLEGDNEGKTLKNFKELQDDIENLFDPFDV